MPGPDGGHGNAPHQPATVSPAGRDQVKPDQR
jgi:hypothetical protein